jgi:hypothetical protein
VEKAGDKADGVGGRAVRVSRVRPLPFLCVAVSSNLSFSCFAFRFCVQPSRTGPTLPPVPSFSISRHGDGDDLPVDAVAALFR